MGSARPTPARPRRDAPSRESERLQKSIAAAGLASRRQAEQWIRAGRVTVNGEVATLGQRVTARDEIRIDGRPLRPPRARPAKDSPQAFMLHRSPGESLAGEMLERLPRRTGRRFIVVSPMPRIDGGLELATADGSLAARLQRRVHGLSSEFSARVRGELDDARLEAIRGGELDGGIRVEVLECEAGDADEASSNRWYRLVVRGASGKQVRELLERQGAVVSRVLRVAIGSVRLPRELGRGQFRALTQEEISALLGSDTAQARGAARPAIPDSRKPDPSRRAPRR